ncbi:Ser/Thr protein phosphatase family protein [Streptococcus pneumoniae]|nr:Ser/Thr protein phosphatase family protein [Streptococcus pneumoniae]
MNHKIAILSDVHGNATALEAVIADAKNQGASEYWLLGDIFLPGPGANDLVALLKDLPIQPVFEAIGMIVSWRSWMGNTVWKIRKKSSSCE